MPLTVSTQQREALKEKGRDLYSRKLYRDALEQFNKAAQGAPSASILDNRAATHEKLGDLDAALQDAMGIIKLQKDLDRGYLRCGSILHKMGKLDKALAVYDKGLERCSSTSLSLAPLRKARSDLQAIVDREHAVDFIGKLPLEILEMVFAMLPFHAMCKCLRVSKAWNQHLKESRRLWAMIDFSAARRNVPAKTVTVYVNRSRHMMKTLVLHRVSIQGSDWLPRLLRPCENLSELIITTGGEVQKTLIAMTKNASSLRKLVTGRTVNLNMKTCVDLLRARPALVHLECQCVTWEIGSSGFSKGGTSYDRLQHLGLHFTSCPVYQHPIVAAGILPLAPALRTLHLSADITNGAMVHVPENELAHVSSLRETVHDLKLRSFYVDTHFAGLRKLRLDDSHILGKFLESDLSEVHINCDAVTEQAKFSPEMIHLYVLNSQNDIPINILHIRVSPQCKTWNWSKECLDQVLRHPRLQGVQDLALNDGHDIMTDDEAKLIADTMTKIERLSLRGSYITGIGVRSLIAGLPRLGFLDVSNCTKISSDALDWARKQGVEVNTAILRCKSL